MPKAPRETQLSYRCDPISRPTHNGHTPSERQSMPNLALNAHSPSIHRIHYILNQAEQRSLGDQAEQYRNEDHPQSESPVEDSEDSISEDDEYANVLGKGYLLRITHLDQGTPQITRILRVPTHLTFHQFHAVLQEAFDWKNDHAYRFDIYETSNQKYDPPRVSLDMPWPLNRGRASLSGSERQRLCDVFGIVGDPLRAEYTFDFGDNWVHAIDYMGPADQSLALSMGIEKAGGHKDVFCVAGEGRCVRLRSRDPYKWDVKKVNKQLRKLALEDYDWYASQGFRR